MLRSIYQPKECSAKSINKKRFIFIGAYKGKTIRKFRQPTYRSQAGLPGRILIVAEPIIS